MFAFRDIQQSRPFVLWAIVFTSAISIACATVAADAYPSRPVHLIVPFEAGGGTDVIARIFAERWAAKLGQPVVVENRAGAAGAVAASVVAHSDPTGYSVCWCTNSPISILPLIEKSLSYNPTRDLRPVGTIYADDGTISVRADLGVDTLDQFVALARRKPGAVAFGSGGIGTVVHLGGMLFSEKAGIQLLHVPYKGEQFGEIDLLGGRIDMYPLSQSSARQLLTQGRIKVLAVRGSARSALLPDVPTLAEAGYAGAESPVLVALFVPAKTPDPVVNTLFGAARGALQDAGLRTQIQTAGGRVQVEDPSATQSLFDAESKKWQQVVGRLDLRSH